MLRAPDSQSGLPFRGPVPTIYILRSASTPSQLLCHVANVVLQPRPSGSASPLRPPRGRIVPHQIPRSCFATSQTSRNVLPPSKPRPYMAGGAPPKTPSPYTGWSRPSLDFRKLLRTPPAFPPSPCGSARRGPIDLRSKNDRKFILRGSGGHDAGLRGLSRHPVWGNRNISHRTRWPAHCLALHR